MEKMGKRILIELLKKKDWKIPGTDAKGVDLRVICSDSCASREEVLVCKEQLIYLEREGFITIPNRMENEEGREWYEKTIKNWYELILKTNCDNLEPIFIYSASITEKGVRFIKENKEEFTKEDFSDLYIEFPDIFD